MHSTHLHSACTLSAYFIEKIETIRLELPQASTLQLSFIPLYLSSSLSQEVSNLFLQLSKYRFDCVTYMLKN